VGSNLTRLANPCQLLLLSKFTYKYQLVIVIIFTLLQNDRIKQYPMYLKQHASFKNSYIYLKLKKMYEGAYYFFLKTLQYVSQLIINIQFHFCFSIRLAQG
jgi:hypothetical protein